jgi:hypothetical protein
MVGSPVTRLSKIEARIAQTTDRRVLARLNLMWWAEFFRLMADERKAA